MSRQVKIIEAKTSIDFEEQINKSILDLWVPHWETFNISFTDLCHDTFYILMEKKLEDIG